MNERLTHDTQKRRRGAGRKEQARGRESPGGGGTDLAKKSGGGFSWKRCGHSAL